MKKKLWVFSFDKEISLEFDSFASVAMANVERRKVHKYFDDRSGKTEHCNRDPLVAGKGPNHTLSIQWIKVSDQAPRAQEHTSRPPHGRVTHFWFYSATCVGGTRQKNVTYPRKWP